MPIRIGGGMKKFECPCKQCPRCGERDSGMHPEDGLAYCGKCKLEWSVGVGDPRKHGHFDTEAQLHYARGFDDGVLYEAVRFPVLPRSN